MIPEKAPASAVPSAASAAAAPAQSSAGGEGASLENKLSAWILAPLIFIFLGFDNGQIRRFFIGLVPNRYFELSLTVLDRLDDAIGKYLRGTLTECFLVGLMLTVGLILLGLPTEIAVTIGVVSGLLNAIPFLGTAIALVIGLGYALVAENIRPLIPGLNPNDLALVRGNSGRNHTRSGRRCLSALCPWQRGERSSTRGCHRDNRRLAHHGSVGHVIRHSHGRGGEHCGCDLLQGTEGLSHHLMGLCNLEGPGRFTYDPDEVSMRLVSRSVIAILLLKFGLAFWNCDLEL